MKRFSKINKASKNIAAPIIVITNRFLKNICTQTCRMTLSISISYLYLAPVKFHSDIPKGSRILALKTNKQPPTHTHKQALLKMIYHLRYGTAAQMVNIYSSTHVFYRQYGTMSRNTADFISN